MADGVEGSTTLVEYCQCAASSMICTGVLVCFHGVLLVTKEQYGVNMELSAGNEAG